MCTTAIAYRQVPGIALLLLSNRDEFHARPTSPAQVWPSHAHIVGGRDLRAGGSWLACNRDGRLANVTNVREPQHTLPDAPSRGRLVTAFIDSDLEGREFAGSIEADAYNGFNMLAWDGNELTFVSNRVDAAITLAPGVYGMSNGLWGAAWPKVVRARRKLSERVRAGTLSDENLLDILLDSDQATDHELPSTGVSPEWERVLSSIFIRTPQYGTRCSTIVKMFDDGRTTLAEYTHVPSRACASSVRLEVVAADKQ